MAHIGRRTGLKHRLCRFESDQPHTMPSCPTCSDTFDTDRAVSIHHKLSHGESIATDESNCKNCGDRFEYYPSDKDGIYCSDCVDKVTWEAGAANDNIPTGENSPVYSGGPNTFTCDFCESEFESYHKNRKYCSMECSGEGRSRDMRGEDHWRWKGGRINYGQNWHKKREETVERDNEQCQICGKKNIEVHHIKPVREFEDKSNAHTLDNLICLCPEHHRKVEFGTISLPKDLSSSSE